MVNVYRNNLAGAREIVEAARKYDVPLTNHSTSAILGVVAFRQERPEHRQRGFHGRCQRSQRTIASTADRYSALDVKGFSLCGLALCGDP